MKQNFSQGSFFFLWDTKRLISRLSYGNKYRKKNILWGWNTEIWLHSSLLRFQDSYLTCSECHTATPGSDVHPGFILQAQPEVSRLPSISWDLQLKAEKDLSRSKTRTSRTIPIQWRKTEPQWELWQIHVKTQWKSVALKLQAWDKHREAALP